MSEIPWLVAVAWAVVACAAGWATGLLIGWWMGKQD